MYRNLINVVGAVCLIGGALGQLLWSLVWPGVSGAPARDNIAAITANPAAASAGSWLDVLLLLLIPAALFVGRALQGGTRVLAGVGAGILFLGSLAFTYSLAGDVVLVAAAHNHSTATAQAFFDSGVMSFVTMIGIVGQVAGFVLLGIAALRSRLIPIWAGVLLIVWNLVQIAGAATGVAPIEAVGDAMLLAAYVACAVRLFRSVDPTKFPSASVAATATA